MMGLIIGGEFVLALVPLLRACSRPVATVVLGIALLGVLLFTADLASLAEIVRRADAASSFAGPTGGFAAIVRGVQLSGLEGAGLVAFAALLAVLDLQRRRPLA